MAVPSFKSFWSTVAPWVTGNATNLKWIFDRTTGAPIGVQSQNANGPCPV
jgi:hypothetical protein